MNFTSTEGYTSRPAQSAFQSCIYFRERFFVVKEKKTLTDPEKKESSPTQSYLAFPDWNQNDIWGPNKQSL